MANFSNQVKKIEVVDSRVHQGEPSYNVFKGASTISAGTTTANSSSVNSLNFTVQVPSQDTYMDRKLELTAEAIFKVNFQVGAGADGILAADTVLADFGDNLSLPAFPIQQIIQTLNVTINGSTVSQSQRKVLNELLRMSNMKKNHLQRGCPTQLDKYGKYTQADNSTMKGYDKAFDSDNVPNGAFTGVNWCDINGNDAQPPKALAALTVQNIEAYFKVRSIEKLVLSPFIFSESEDDTVGLFGLQSFNVSCNFTTDLSRLLRFYSTTPATRKTSITNISFANPAQAWRTAEINTIFRGPAIGQSMPTSSIVPYMNIGDIDSIISQPLAIGATNQQMRSSTSTLSQIPDYLLIYVKPNNLTNEYGDCYLPITNITMKFMGSDGLLSSLSTFQLFEMSVKNSLNMDYNQYIGSAHGSTSNGEKSVLTGGFVILRPGIDFPLPAQYAPGVGGSFSISVEVRVNNHLGIVINQSTLTIANINSGFFVTSNGQSATILEPVTTAEVSNMATDKSGRYDKLDSQELRRLVGGGWFDDMTSGIKTVFNNPLTKATLGVMKEVAKNSGDPKGEALAAGLGAIGAGRTTGGKKKKGLESMVFSR